MLSNVLTVPNVFRYTNAQTINLTLLKISTSHAARQPWWEHLLTLSVDIINIIIPWYHWLLISSTQTATPEHTVC